MSDVLLKIANDQALLEAVKGLILKQFSTDSLEATMADMELGQLVRARLVGMKAVDDAFAEIAALKTLPPRQEKTNPAK